MGIFKVIFGIILFCFMVVFVPIIKAITWVILNVVSSISWIMINFFALVIGLYFYSKKLFKSNEKPQNQVEFQTSTIA